MGDYTDRASVKEFASITNTDSDNKIDSVITQVSRIIDQATGRFFDTRPLTALKTQAEHGRVRKLYIFNEEDGLNYLPIISITLVKENGFTLVQGTDFFLEKSTGALVRDTGISTSFRSRFGFWTTLQEQIEITGSFGFAVTPPDIKAVANEMVASICLLLTKTFTTAAGEEQTITLAKAREYAEIALGRRRIFRP